MKSILSVGQISRRAGFTTRCRWICLLYMAWPL